jgi:hypothetical protein
MTALCYTVEPSHIGRTPTWKLVDSRGRVCAETTDRSLIGEMIAAKCMTAILVANCAKVGILPETYARYQHAEDEFNEE